MADDSHRRRSFARVRTFIANCRHDEHTRASCEPMVNIHTEKPSSNRRRRACTAVYGTARSDTTGGRRATMCDDVQRMTCERSHWWPTAADERAGGLARSLGAERSADRHARCYGNSTTVDDSGCSVNGIAQAAD